jgi:hypothetical protein
MNDFRRTGKTSKPKNSNYLIMILIAMCVGMTTYSFINNHFTTIARTTVQNINSTVKTGNLNTILTGVQIDSGTKLSTTTKTIKTTKTRPSQTTTTE